MKNKTNTTALLNTAPNTKIKISVVGFSILLALSSCTMEKRVYMSGYNIQWNTHKSALDKNESVIKIAKQVKENKVPTVEQPEKESNIAYSVLTTTNDNVVTASIGKSVIALSNKTVLFNKKQSSITAKPNLISEVKIVKATKENKKQSTRLAGSRKTQPKEREIKDIIELQQIDGKVHKTGARDIYEIMGEKNPSKYGTTDIKEYEKKLNRMNTSDLQHHAASVQVLPREDRRLLIKLLLKQFQIDNSGILNVAKPLGVSQKKMSQRALDILAEGR